MLLVYIGGVLATCLNRSYPDANLPTLLVYNEGQCKQNVVGMSQFGGQRATPEQVRPSFKLSWGHELHGRA